LERLSADYDITIFFYGDNLDTADEYNRRLQALFTVNKILNKDRPMIICPYRHNEFLLATADLTNEPEGGRRCEKCFTLRLSKTVEIAVANGFGLFATTLTTSPHKNAGIINAIGETVARQHGIAYLPTDLKQNGGFARSVELSKQLGIYRQKYCGCKKD
jgi:predicted adenine nucleotide alpha hydrolase (AANH) superfamily ATPase